MCGIAGIISREKPVSRRHLAGMAESLRHRGPDESNYGVWERVGLAHTRLSIIDLEGGGQPLHDRELTLSLVANGEIYNYLELRAALKQRGSHFLTRSATLFGNDGNGRWKMRCSGLN